MNEWFLKVQSFKLPEEMNSGHWDRSGWLLGVFSSGRQGGKVILNYNHLDSLEGMSFNGQWVDTFLRSNFCYKRLVDCCRDDMKKNKSVNRWEIDSGKGYKSEVGVHIALY